MEAPLAIGALTNMKYLMTMLLLSLSFNANADNYLDYATEEVYEECVEASQNFSGGGDCLSATVCSAYELETNRLYLRNIYVNGVEHPRITLEFEGDRVRVVPTPR